MPSLTRLDADFRLRVCLFCLLLGIYLLVYIPKPDSADGDALLAVAASTLREGSPNINAVAYADWLLPLPASRMGAFGVDGALYAKKGPTPSLALLPLVALADALPWLATRATAMLLNPLLTAGTALLLYSLARRLGYRPGVAFALGLIYGVATFAIVYVKTLFGEPLAAFLLLAALLAAHRFRGEGRRVDLVLSGVALGLLVGVNTVYVIMIPLVGLYLFDLRLSSKMVRDAALFAAPVVVALALLALYNAARFGSPFDSGYHFGEGEGFNQPLLTGLYGLFLSPFRGLFWYNPVLLLAIPGWWMLRRQDARLAWTALVLVAAGALAFAAWWSWHGGIVWGPRFLIPITPLIALFLAPLLDTALRRGTNRVWVIRAALVGLIGLSVGVQALGALYSYFPYINGYLNAHYWTGIWDSAVTALRDEVLYTPALSPIVGHLALASAGWPLEPAWLAAGIDGTHLLAALALIGIGLVSLIAPRRFASGLAVIVTLISLNVVAARHADTDMQALNAALQPRGTVVAATTLYESALLDLERQRVVTMNAPTALDDEWAEQLWDYARRTDSPLWLLTWFGPGDALNWQERELWQSASFVREASVPGHRALHFDLHTVPAQSESGWRFGPIGLAAYGVERRADGVFVTLDWTATEPIEANLTWFVHLIDASGAIQAQQDRPPQGGFAPTSGWEPGAAVTDRLFFPLATEIQGWQIRVGWVDAAGQPLPVTDDEGTRQDEDYVLLPVD